MSTGLELAATVRTDSVSCRTGRPYWPWTRRATIHQRHTPTVSTAMRAVARTTATNASRPRVASTTNQSAGPMPTNSSELALTEPIVRTTSANSAGSRQPCRRTARMLSPTSHGRPAQASSSTEIRAVNASWYGVSM